jgi:hypothetical protein
MLFMPKRWDYICELRPLAGLLFISPMNNENVEALWNPTDKVKRKNSEKKTVPEPLSTTYTIWNYPGVRQSSAVRGQRPTAWSMARPTSDVT